jgi:hypothetical protein
VTVLFPRDRRRTRFGFEWTARSAVERASLDALSGHAATFTRASIGTGFGSDGYLVPYNHSQPRWIWLDLDSDGVRETPHLLLEVAATNVALRNRDLTNASWTKTNITAAKDQTGIDGIASSASKITATAGNGTCLQAITLASSSRMQTAYVKRITGSGTINMTTDNGSTWTAITVTSTTAWSRVSIPAQTVTNPTIGFRIVTNGDAIAVDFVQNETGPVATSPIPTTTAAVTRSTDTLVFALTDIPKNLTSYIKFVELGSAALNAALFGIGDGSNAAFYVKSESGLYTATHRRGSDATSALGVTPVTNDIVELRAYMPTDASAVIARSINSAAEVVSGGSAASTFATAWNTSTLRVNALSAGNFDGAIALNALRLANGTQTLTTMREG